MPAGRSAIRVVSMDLDDTLVTREYVDYFWLELVPRLYAEASGLPFEEARRRVFESYDEVGEDDLRWYLPDYWFRRFNIRDRLEEALREAGRRVRPYPDALRVVRELKDSVELVISTNAAREFVELVFEAVPEFRDAFKRVYSCVSDFGIARKTPRFYRLVCADLGVEPSEVLHVGDDPVYDREVPRSVGIKAFSINREGGGDLRSLYEVLELLDP